MIRVTFDGDSYDMTVPTIDIVRQMLTARGEGELELDRHWAHNFVIQTTIHGDKQILKSSAAWPGEQRKNHILLEFWNGAGIDDDGNHLLHKILFWPMLIPLDKNNTADPKAISGVQNGDILEGGTFFVETTCKPDAPLIPLITAMAPVERKEEQDIMSMFVSLGLVKEGKPPATFDREHFQLRDSTGVPEETLQWVYWDGMLVCTKPICYTNVADLNDARIF